MGSWAAAIFIETNSEPGNYYQQYPSPTLLVLTKNGALATESGA